MALPKGLGTNRLVPRVEDSDGASIVLDRLGDRGGGKPGGRGGNPGGRAALAILHDREIN